MSFSLGVIEGFYGKMWTAAARLDLFAFIATQGFECFVHAPKGERKLRGGWAEPFSIKETAALQLQSETCASLGLRWGVGLSPLGAVAKFDNAVRRQLRFKLHQLNNMKPALLCVLFDDMHCEYADLAGRQLAIVDFIAEHCAAHHIIVCPTYYSYDPVLEKVFGERPKAYWRDLGANLAAEIDVFWTGNRVCSASIQCNDMLQISEDLQRAPVIWDNYPVNDGEKASNFLNLKPFQQRDWRLAQTTRGHFSNPMNQCALSKIVLHSLPRLFEAKQNYSADVEFDTALETMLDIKLARCIREDVDIFSKRGLCSLNSDEKHRLLSKYMEFNVDYAAEIAGWLRGEYVFDPACLTEQPQ